MSKDVTQLLENWTNGDKSALADLIPLVYDELHKMASNRLVKERSGHTLQPTALVNELYLRMVKWQSVNWQNRAHFFAVAANLMRHILVDYARTQLADKRVNPKNRLSLDDLPDQVSNQDLDLIELDDALAGLAAIDPQQGRIIELRFFGGLTIHETAEVMNLSPKIVRREWELAKLWLLREMDQNRTNESGTLAKD